MMMRCSSFNEISLTFSSMLTFIMTSIVLVNYSSRVRVFSYFYIFFFAFSVPISHPHIYVMVNTRRLKNVAECHTHSQILATTSVVKCKQLIFQFEINLLLITYEINCRENVKNYTNILLMEMTLE